MAIINEYSSWARVESVDDSMAYMSTFCGQLHSSLVNRMTLIVHHAHGRYRQGDVLYIPMADLHDAIQELAVVDSSFASRVTQLQMSRHDVESIVSKATHGLVRLLLTENFLPSHLGTY